LTQEYMNLFSLTHFPRRSSLPLPQLPQILLNNNHLRSST
jgi:hypothetical protein